jgi:hypothetical protein
LIFIKATDSAPAMAWCRPAQVFGEGSTAPTHLKADTGTVRWKGYRPSGVVQKDAQTIDTTTDGWFVNGQGCPRAIVANLSTETR